MRVIDSQYVTMFLVEGQALIPSAQEDPLKPAVMRPAREALREAYASGWQPYREISLGTGKNDQNNTQIQVLLHLVKYGEDEPAVKRGRPAKEDA